MKRKSILFTIIFAIMLSVFTVPAFAAQNLMEIFRPDGNEIVTKEVFSISGSCTYEDTTIIFQYSDDEGKTYKPLLTTEGYSSFKVGSNKLFAKEVKLKKGENIIKITAKTKNESQPSKPFTITYNEESKKGNWLTDSISNTVDSIMNWLGK